MLYITFFPKVISGPIVLWQDFSKQIKTSRFDFNLSSDGINLIMIGFAKKAILADTFGFCLSKFGLYDIDRITAAGALVLYTLQMYYDFSGYSDIAIGISRLFGFEFKKNFDYPYLSTSISEFWRRWHISLGTWFRQYVYFPLGGSRRGLKRTLINLSVVFVLTGIWHGAGWNYILWGAINGIFVVLERVISNNRLYNKTPKLIKNFACMLIVTECWQLFKYSSIKDALRNVAIVFGISSFESIPYTWQYYFDNQIIFLMAVGIIGATISGLPKIVTLKGKILKSKVGFIISELLLFAVFAVSIMFIVNSTYSPFIYFRY